ncbi:MAG: DUF3999 family protein [Kiritimatiellia bacterium]
MNTLPPRQTNLQPSVADPFRPAPPRAPEYAAAWHCRAAGLSAVLALLALPALAAPADLAQPVARRVELAPLAREEIVTTTLDSAVYAAAGNTLADLRLVAGETDEVPYVLETITATATHLARAPVAVTIESLRETGSNGVEVIWAPVFVRGSPLPVVRGFQVETPLRNFERRLDVYGNEDGTWRKLASQALLYDYTQYMDVRRTAIELPANRATSFRMQIEDIVDTAASPFLEITRQVNAQEQSGSRRERFTLTRRPLRIDRISAWELRDIEEAPRAQIVSYGALPFTTATDAKEKQTILTLTSRREPLTQLVLDTTSRNFSRHAELQIPRGDGLRTEWQTVAQTTLSAIAFQSFSEQHLAFDFGAQRQPQYRIVIHNGDNPPLTVTGVQGLGLSQRLVFLNNGNKPLRLVYGREDVRQPEYDTVSVMAAIRNGSQLITARLGPVDGGSGTTRGFSWKRVLNSPVFFGVAVVIAVLALGAMLYAAVKRAGNMDSQPGA